MGLFIKEIEAFLIDTNRQNAVLQKLEDICRGDKQKADEIFQTTRVKLWKRSKSYKHQNKDIKSIEGYFYTTAKNIFIDEQRKKRSRKNRALRAEQIRIKKEKQQRKEKLRQEKIEQLNSVAFQKILKEQIPDPINREIFMDKESKKMPYAQMVIKYKAKGYKTKKQGKYFTVGTLRTRLTRIKKVLKDHLSNSNNLDGK